MVVGTVSTGVNDLKSVLNKISKEGYGLRVQDGDYILESIVNGLGKDLNHIATSYDIGYMGSVRNLPSIPPKMPLKEYFNDENLQEALDIYLADDAGIALLKYNPEGYLYLWHYDIERCLLLFKILNAKVNDFYIQMKDHMSRDDFSKSAEYGRIARSKTKEYEEKYGKLPEFQTIDDVIDIRNELAYGLSIS